MFIIFRHGMFETAYPATEQHVANVLRKRLMCMGWRALWRAPKVGRKRVMAYFGMEEAHDTRGQAVAARCAGVG